MAFAVDQRIVCISSSWTNVDIDHAIMYPKKGRIYTVRGYQDPMVAVFAGCAGTGPYIMLHEIVNKASACSLGMIEPAFSVQGFRPITERKTDIEIFIKMLDPTRIPEPV